jgi:hypothetical protein
VIQKKLIEACVAPSETVWLSSAANAAQPVSVSGGPGPGGRQTTHTPVSFSEDITTCDLPTPKDLGDAAQAAEEVAATKSAARQGSIIIAVCFGPEASHPAAARAARSCIWRCDGG